MLELNDLAFQNAELLVVLGEDAAGWSVPDLATRLDRDRSNLRKSLIKLHEAGLLTSAVMPELTDAGRVQREAILRARQTGEARVGSGGPEGPTNAGQQQRAPLSAFIPNPANRRVTDQSVQVMADTIEAVGDVLERIKATPADATGVRMLLDGETRWRACALMAEQGRLPAALAEGIPFEEREATAAEQILIRIVTASARTDLTPLDDARQLLALQQETGWSAREIAKKTGRSPADSDTGVRDVQVKIKVAREATPFFLAQYELDGSWDRLRDSVTEKKPTPVPAPDPDQPALPAELAAPPAAEGAARAWTEAEVFASPMKEGYRNQPAIIIRLYYGAAERPGTADAWAYDREAQVGSMRLTHFMDTTRDPDQVFATRAAALAAAVKMVRRDYGSDLPRAYAEWMDQLQGPFFVNGVDRLNASNAGEARRALGWEARKANSGGGAAKAAVVEAPVAPPPAPTLDDRADRMRVAAQTGSEFVLGAAITELVEAIDSHLAGIRRDLVQGGQDLAQFEEDTEALRDAAAAAGDALEALSLGEGEGLAPLEDRAKPPALGEPFVPIRKSITPEHVTCLYDGRRFAGGLRRHLLTRYNETPDEYRRKWALPADYPMVAPNHAKRQHDALRAAALRTVGR